MAGTVVPVVGREPHRWLRSTPLWIHGIGSVIAAATFGAAIGLVGSSLLGLYPSNAALSVAGIAAVVLALKESGLIALPLPQVKAQVPSGWRGRFAPRPAAFLYGMGLGVGVATYIRFAGFYLVILWAAVSGPVAGAVLLGCYGVGRFIPLFLIWLKPRSHDDILELTTRSLPVWQPVVQGANVAVLAFVGTYFYGSAFLT